MTTRPGQFTVHHYGAVSFHTANRPTRTEELIGNYQHHLFTTMLVIQEIAYDSQHPTAETRLTDRFELEPVFELQYTAQLFLRISRVVAIR